MNSKLTLIDKKLTKGSKGISIVDMKTKPISELMNQYAINKKYNSECLELKKLLKLALKDVEISWIADGSFAISTSSSLVDIQKCVDDLKLDITINRSDLSHRRKSIDPNDVRADSEEDVDQIIIQDSSKGKNKLKSTSKENKYQTRKK